MRLQGLAADLLLLARLDAGERPGRAAVDLGALVREEVSQWTGDRIPPEVSVAGAVPLEATGSRGQLARVVGNLLDNAERHAERAVAVSVRAGRGEVIVEVTDGDDHLPRRRRAEAGDEAGRGIAIIATIASGWGTRRTLGGGKTVWCEFALPAQ